MKLLTADLTTAIKFTGISSQTADDLPSIANQLLKPNIPISNENTYFRVMYIASDKVNSFGGRFSEAEMIKLTELIPGSPVMVGHRRDQLPIARNFYADFTTDDEDTKWVRSYFYWMKDSEGAESLKLNIDSGIYRECSLSFSYTYPECSVCGEDIRKCPHIPLDYYSAPDGSSQQVFYYYRGIKKVIELSLVYRGAVPDTKITSVNESGSKGITLTAASKAGNLDIFIFSEGDFPLQLNHPYTCSLLGSNSTDGAEGFKTVKGSAFIDIEEDIPKTLFVENSPLSGLYNFSRVRQNNKYRLILTRKV